MAISSRRRARETVLKALYQSAVAGDQLELALEDVLNDTVYLPVVTAAVPDLLKRATSEEVLSGDVEGFASDLSYKLAFLPSKEENSIYDAVISVFKEYFKKIPQGEEENIKSFVNNLGKKNARLSKIADFSRELTEIISQHFKKIDVTIESASENWTLDRMSEVDKAILRLGSAELLYFDSIPPKVTLNEAVELAKKYSADKSREFVNGILDKIAKETAKEEKVAELVS
ncbi:MAG: transcription antitermination factor NusB [Candidatus Riflebacteria bacterium]|nr:transcription antitermination factor NusB [Candidatus Riflebacteria bacterium]